MTFYAVAVGRQTGIFTQPWNVVCKYVNGYSGAKYKGFKTMREAEKYMASFGSPASPSPKATASRSTDVDSPIATSAAASEGVDNEKLGNLPGLHLYTDGGHHKYTTPGGKTAVGTAASVVVVRDGIEIYHKARFLGKQTNNIGELTALRYAFQYIARLSADVLYADDRPVVIHSDSEYAIGVVTGTMAAAANLDLVNPLKEWYNDAKFKVQIKHIPAHSGYKYNERADELCNDVIDTPGHPSLSFP